MRMRFWLLASWLLLAGCAAEHQAVRDDARPEQQLLISPRLYRLLLELKAKRFEVEVAHWV